MHCSWRCDVHCFQISIWYCSQRCVSFPRDTVFDMHKAGSSNFTSKSKTGNQIHLDALHVLIWQVRTLDNTLVDVLCGKLYLWEQYHYHIRVPSLLLQREPASNESDKLRYVDFRVRKRKCIQSHLDSRITSQQPLFCSSPSFQKQTSKFLKILKSKNCVESGTFPKPMFYCSATSSMILIVPLMWLFMHLLCLYWFAFW